jgi:ABC-type transport system involved in cytochrome bd biosynthesis fused ATPase/permease subunit
VPQHPSSGAWLWAIAALLAAVAVHALVAWWLCKARDGEMAKAVKPRTVGLFVLAFTNPLLPLTAPILLLLAYRSFAQGIEPSPSTDSIRVCALPKESR